MGAVRIGRCDVHRRQQQGSADRDRQAEDHQQEAGDEQLFVQRDIKKESSGGCVRDTDNHPCVMPGVEPFDEQDLTDRSHCNARHEDAESIGGVAVQRVGDRRHHVHQRERQRLQRERQAERGDRDRDDQRGLGLLVGHEAHGEPDHRRQGPRERRGREHGRQAGYCEERVRLRSSRLCHCPAPRLALDQSDLGVSARRGRI
jgi:hypothetical protein